MSVRNLSDLLHDAAKSHGAREVVSYFTGDPDKDSCARLSYTELHRLAISNISLIRDLHPSKSNVLLHFGDHVDNIIWLWSTIYAGFTPVMSTPLPRSPGQCIKHLEHLDSLLEHPVCLTRESLRGQFPETVPLRIVEIEHLQARSDSGSVPDISDTREDIPALLMLTSGSTGPCKAVPLKARQIIASLAGKCAALPVDPDYTFLNWIRLDHVGSLIEIHLHALYSGCSQVHVQPEDIISHPLKFLQVIQEQRVASTFAPNFFLAELNRCLDPLKTVKLDLDISCLRYIVSGGEANVVATCSRLSTLLARYGAPDNVIVPGFGMTETCAGCIYNRTCPRYEMDQGYEFASMGTCIPGIEFRISSSAGSIRIPPGEVGDLEVRGPVVFDSYYNDPTSTDQAFRSDGWFRTGDTGFIDGAGKLNLSGRTKEVICINGVKYLPHELEVALEEAEISGIAPESVVCFAHRPPGADTEQACAVYQHSYPSDDYAARSRVMAAITHRIMLITNGSPYILPLPAVERTSLGKISRSQLKADLESGKLCQEQSQNEEQIRHYQQSMFEAPATPTEQVMVEELAGLLQQPTHTLGVESDLFEMGVTSIGLVQLHRRLQERLSLDDAFTVSTCMSHHTIRELAKACHDCREYNPVVTLRPHGSKTPLWLVHPAAGEALVFINLAKLMPDRPVYAFRARGFGDGEPYFTSIEECVRTYHSAMKKLQPRGPYAILGYSYGGMLAFELSKLLEAEGESVKFLASLNRPPYVSPRLRQVTWTECLVNISYFLGLLSQDSFRKLLGEMRDISNPEAITRLINMADQSQLLALGLDGKKLEQWINVAFSLQEIGRSYEPKGSVAHLDVFYCDPLEFLGVTREQWLEKLSAWQDFSREETLYFAVQGEHASALGPQNVQAFYKTLRKALAVRGA
ncbi:thioesterase domain protein [Aspergillus heteromorphus CBS 117.55]|uniref:Thioesterase domain protein n=1 Tax=Aspergillus heteromorphus CBS 117.55 TaxID=1448321 RepID=A0A317UXC3_9EURO|nr:thioesterase domain protein [Aspergillus heteromorphus CBS 117.55]PWY65979.1 thioesterase domain protein [Aspergillus heteromorphus CBS 117.55]